MPSYSAIFDHVANLPCVAQVSMGGRGGSDAFHSLFDSHPMVLTFNGQLYFHTFWLDAVTTAVPEPNLEDIADEFIGIHIDKLKSAYDIVERKGHLGANMDQSIDIDLNEFREHTIGLMKNRDLNSKNFMFSVYGAYNLCIGHPIEQTKLLFHHIHHIRKLPEFLKDFPDSKIISTLRDPRAGYISMVEHAMEGDFPGYHHVALRRMLEEALHLISSNGRFCVVRMDDFGNQSIMENVCEWLGIEYNSALENSTWGGLRWWGDIKSTVSNIQDEKEFNRAIRGNKWEGKLKGVDRFLFEFLLEPTFEWYGYETRKIPAFPGYFMAAILIPWPIWYDRKFLCPTYALPNLKRGNVRYFLRICYYYVKRILFYYNLLARRLRGTYTRLPYFTTDGIRKPPVP